MAFLSILTGGPRSSGSALSHRIVNIGRSELLNRGRPLVRMTQNGIASAVTWDNAAERLASNVELVGPGRNGLNQACKAADQRAARYGITRGCPSGLEG